MLHADVIKTGGCLHNACQKIASTTAKRPTKEKKKNSSHPIDVVQDDLQSACGTQMQETNQSHTAEPPERTWDGVRARTKQNNTARSAARDNIGGPHKQQRRHVRSQKWFMMSPPSQKGSSFKITRGRVGRGRAGGRAGRGGGWGEGRARTLLQLWQRLLRLPRMRRCALHTHIRSHRTTQKKRQSPTCARSVSPRAACQRMLYSMVGACTFRGPNVSESVSRGVLKAWNHQLGTAISPSTFLFRTSAQTRWVALRNERYVFESHAYGELRNFLELAASLARDEVPPYHQNSN